MKDIKEESKLMLNSPMNTPSTTSQSKKLGKEDFEFIGKLGNGA